MGKGGMGMVKRTVVLADSDGVYLKRLSDYFMEKAPQLELSIFTDLSMLKQYLQRGRVDIWRWTKHLQIRNWRRSPLWR